MLHGSMTHDYTGRKIKKKKLKGEVYKKYKAPAFQPLTRSTNFRRDEGVVYASNESSTSGICAAPEKKEYTGTLVKGIGTMHKSNAVPIIDEQQMKDLASMRR
jgi:hypothetical protein